MNLIGNLVIVFMILICLLLGYIKLQSINHPGEVPSVFGFKMLMVLSGSMSPVFEAGDIVLIKQEKDIKAGDIITYQMNGSYVTHRVKEILSEGGQAQYQTKGDANNVQDQYMVSANQVEGLYQWRIPKGAIIVQYVSHPIGLLFLGTCFILYFSMRAFVQLNRKKLINQ